MEYSYLIDGLSRVGGPMLIQHIHVVSQQSHTMEVQGAQLMRTQGLDREHSFYSPNILFVGLVSELPEDPARAPLHCICIEDVPLPSVYTQDANTRDLVLLQMQSNDSALMFLLNTVCFVLMDDFRYYQGLEWVAEASRANADLQALADLAERITVNPCVIVDHERRILAVSQELPVTEAELIEAVHTRQISPQTLWNVRERSVYEALQEDYLANSHLAWTFRNTLAIPLRIQGIQIGTLIVQSYCTAFYHSVIQLMEPLATLIGQQIANYLRIQEDRSLLHSLLFNELLRAMPQQESILRRRLREMDWDETEDMVCAICQPATLLQAGTEPRYAALRKFLPGCRWSISAGAMSLLIYPMDSGSWAKVESVLTEQDLVMGCSWPTDNLMDMRFAHHQARIALDQGCIDQPEKHIHYYSRYFSGHVLQLRPEEVLNYLQPAVRTLAEYDRSHEGNLLETLERYLAGPDQPNEIAASLFIHRSTLFYRLNRIREVVHVDWSTGEERLNLLLALRLLKQLR